jgi:hypothetical protein
MRELIRLFAKIVKELMLQNKRLKKLEDTLMATREELNAGIAEIHTAVDADLAQTQLVITKINELIAAIAAAGNTDFQAEVDALKAATAKLSSDNAAVQAALDQVVPPTPQP